MVKQKFFMHPSRKSIVVRKEVPTFAGLLLCAEIDNISYPLIVIKDDFSFKLANDKLAGVGGVLKGVRPSEFIIDYPT